MAQNITLLNASYTAVPAVTLPKTGGGTATFTDVTDTTATAADVSSGKIFFTADGTQTTGTASGGGGATNFVTGTFNTGTSTGATHTLAIPYTGSGYPIMCYVCIGDGAYNTAIGDWYTSVQRYAVGVWSMSKAVMTSAPTYSTSGTQNYGVTTAIYKNSTSSSTSYTRTSGMNTNTFSSSNAANAALTCVRFKNSTTLSYYVASTSYGLMGSMDYRYFIVYSS